MGKKLTIEYVRQFFKDHGCELLSTEYINNSTALNYICKCGEIGNTMFNNFKKRLRCDKCGRSTQRTNFIKNKVNNGASLAVNSPHLLFEWNYLKNSIIPEEITYGSGVKVWWICSNGHEWEATISDRTSKNNGCPYCSKRRVSIDNCLSTTNISLVEQWCFSKNKITPEEVTNGSTVKVWWKCEKGHEWESIIRDRAIYGTGCPYCSNNFLVFENSLRSVKPKLCEEWHYDKNKELTPDIIHSKSNKKVWWVCEVGHEWKTSVNSRCSGNNGKGTNCPYCAGNKLDIKNSIMNRSPELANEWNYEKNILKPSELSCGSGIYVWWKCSDGHEWKTSPLNRKKSGCPTCKISSGERAIKQFLELNSFHYEFQYRLDDCKRERVLPFDFAIFNKGALFMLIEFDGIQHFKPIEVFGGEKAFQYTKNNDKIKNKYCKDNSIRLLRIKYNDNIEKVLSEELGCNY